MLVRVLGAAGTVPAGEAEVRLRPMERLLVTALAVRHPAALSVDSLIEAMWPGAPPQSARKTVQNNVLRVRHLLGAMAIETVVEGYRLGDGLDTDLARFEQAMRDRRRRDLASDWDEVLAWCPDLPLDHLRHWAPADARRTRLDELRSSAVEARWEAALGRIEPDHLVSELEALVAEAPLREQRWRLLLAAYQRAGRRAEALRAYERARRTLAMEIGVSPGVELAEAYEAVLRDVPVRIGADGDTPPPDQDLTASGDDHRAAGDLRRLADAALAASGDGWRTGFDATADAVRLLTAALAAVPPAPTPLRSRLLARSAVVRSHHAPASECEAQASKALAIGRAVDDVDAIAAALHALNVVVWDPFRRGEHRAWLDELLALATSRPEEPWRRWALPILARVLAREGDVTGAGCTLDQLGEQAAEVGDAGAVFAAAQVAVLRASVAGDWPAARAAAEAVCEAAKVAGFDAAGAAMHRRGILGIVSLLEGPNDVAPLAPIEWPVASMELTVAAWHADSQARAGRCEAAAGELAWLDPASIAEVEHDGYWVPTMSMLADAAYLTGSMPIAEVVLDCLVSLTDLTIVDPGLLYRGAVAHSAGLAAATSGRRNDAVDLLRQGHVIHQAHGSPWMTARSHEALAPLIERAETAVRPR